MIKFEFISKENFNKIPNRNNRKNKNRLFYTWKIERFSCHQNADIEIDIFPSQSKAIGIQMIKKDLIKEMNNGNLFDYQYSPQEKDYLSIINLNDHYEYLRLIYTNGKWIEEEYLYANRNYFDTYIEVESGYIEIK